MTKRLKHIIPNVEEWPIYKISKNRSSFIEGLNEFVLARLLATHSNDLKSLLEKTSYLEKKRVKLRPWKVDPADDKSYWNSIAKEVIEISQSDHSEEEYLVLLKRVINRYNEEIVGTFKPKTYRFIKKVLAWIFKRLLNTAAGRNHHRIWGSRHQLHERLNVVGNVDVVRSLFDHGTVVMVPTHFSNMDSILIGYSLDEVVGLPAAAFGAGLNLYDVEIIGWFMNRLGAYRVDRRKKNPIYLECLKGMASYSLEQNVNQIFFPGGTRSRDGSMEDRLKLGLLGSVTEAQRKILMNGEKKKIFVVPLVVGYHFVLEAKFLINQYLQQKGKEKYTKEKDQFKSYSKMLKFIWNIFSEKSEITLSFGTPMDIMGNKINEKGESLNKFGEVLDLGDYFKTEANMEVNHQRENIYTRLLSDEILKSYYKYNVILSSHLMAYAAFIVFRRMHRSMDLYSVLNVTGDEATINWEYFVSVIAAMQEVLIEWESEEKLILSKEIRLPSEDLIKDGIKNVGIYHSPKPLEISKDGNILSRNLRLLYFYHNRIENYGLDKCIDWEQLEMANPV